MKLANPRVDPDPRPRAAPVGPGSAYQAVAAAATVNPTDMSLHTGTAPVAPRREREVRDWLLQAGDSPEERPVSAPHVWSRAEPDLVDFKGPCRYRLHLPAGEGHRRLLFGGLDYVATILLDGTQVATHEGGFTPVAVDLPADAVSVAVQVDDPVEPTLLGENPVAAAKRKVKGVFEFHDSRPGGHVASLSWSPLWARRWGTGGIVEPVTLLTTGAARLDATFVTATPDRLSLSWVTTNLTPAPLPVSLRAVLAGPGAGQTLSVAAELPPGAGRVSVELDVREAAPWAPGAGRLYRLDTELCVGAGELSDTSSVRFGVREVAMSLEPDGTEFQLRIDGRRHYVRAANYIPGVWLPELTQETFRRDIELAQAANLNSFGPHAHVLPERFYDLADSHGLLVYQDFPLNLANDPAGEPLLPGGPTMAAASQLLAAEMAYRLYNHPSVVYYCCHNEPAYQLGEAFRGATVPEVARMQRAFAEAPDEEKLDLARAELLRQVDPGRPAFFASGVGRTRPVGDNHSYSGSLTTDPTTTITGVSVPFLSEFGAWTANFSAAEHVNPARGDWPPGPDAPGEWDRQTHFYISQALRAGRPDRYPDYPSWTYAGHLWAGAFIKLGVEAFRSRMWNPAGGHRYHLFVDHWGGGGAGVVDRHRLRQYHYWSLAAANRPLLPVVEALPSMRTEPGPVRLRTWVIDDRPAATGTGRVRWELHRLPPGSYHLIGVDDPQIPDAFGPHVPPAGDLVVLPRGTGERIDSGGWDFECASGASQPGPTLQLDVPAAEPTAYLVRLIAEHGEETVANWSAFMAAPPDWSPPPGMSAAPKFDLTLTGAGPFRLVRRWTGTTVREGAVAGMFTLTGLAPDQYLLEGPVVTGIDLYGDVTADLASGTAACQGQLPWWFDARTGR
jgi:beta-mannosidase